MLEGAQGVETETAGTAGVPVTVAIAPAAQVSPGALRLAGVVEVDEKVVGAAAVAEAGVRGAELAVQGAGDGNALLLYHSSTNFAFRDLIGVCG